MGQAKAATMKVISAYMLAVLGGNEKPGVSDVKKIISSIGAEMSEDDNRRLEELVEEMVSKDLNEVLEAGHAKLKTVPGGGGGGGAAVAATAGPADGAAPAADAAADDDDDDDDMDAAPATGLFDGDDD